MVNIRKIPVNSYESNNYKIICDDCFNVMKEIPENSIDLYIADPPYFSAALLTRRSAFTLTKL